jgi:ATP-dependent Clp protease ATP-binding subunit ClpA
MFERFTTSARQVVEHTQEEARRLQHDSIGSEHLLLGMLAEQHGVGARILREAGLRLDDVRDAVARRSPALSDAAALETLGIDLEAVRRKLEATFGPGALDRRPAGRKRGHIPFDGDAKQALELALRESLRLKHRYIGTEHILLGLLRQNRGLAGDLLRDAGVDHAEVTARVRSEAASG